MNQITRFSFYILFFFPWEHHRPVQGLRVGSALAEEQLEDECRNTKISVDDSEAYHDYGQHEETEEVLISNLIDWLKENGAYINEKVEIRQIFTSATTDNDRDDGTNEPQQHQEKLSGLFANQDIQKGEVVCTIPWDLVLKPNYFSIQQQGSFCAAVSAVYDAITKKPSLQTPYERYLAKRNHNHLPKSWTMEGQNILFELLNGHSTKGGKGKKKKKEMGFLDIYIQDCLGGEDDYAYDIVEDKREDDKEFDRLLDDEDLLNAISIVYGRGEGPNLEHFIPFHDMINHGNGKRWNVHMSDPRLPENDGVHYELYAKRNIRKGEQLQHSYNQCPWCENYSNPMTENRFYVTTELFVWYGFIEQYPQRWIVPQQRLLFDIDEQDQQEVEATFIVPPSNRSIEYLVDTIQRLDSFKHKYNETAAQPSLPENEWHSIWQFHSAMIVAYENALRSTSNEKLYASEMVWDLRRNQWYLEDHDIGGWYWAEERETDDGDGDHSGYGGCGTGDVDHNIKNRTENQLYRGPTDEFPTLPQSFSQD